MRAIILAAGTGRRLADMGWDRPKCLLPCPGGTLLDHLLSALWDHDIREAVLVVGYQRELVEEAAGRWSGRCRFVVNEDFAESNTLHSLSLTRAHFDGGFFFANGDVWFDAGLIGRLLGTETSSLAVRVGHCATEDVKVAVDDAGRATRIGKELTGESIHGEFVGLARFTAEGAGAFSAALSTFDHHPDRKDLYFESALNAVLPGHKVLAVPLDKHHALEIDTPADFAAAQALWGLRSPDT